MRGPRGALLIAALFFASLAGAESPRRDVYFVTLLAEAAHGLSETEAAAWLVRESDGRETLVPWPFANRRKCHAWNRPLPPGAVALLHTHPATSSPRPSVRDRDVARRLRVPVYTVSLWGIYRVDPDGTVSPVASPCWTPAIDWVLANELLSALAERDTTAEGSSAGPFS